jgi:hypothetical protein
MIRCVTEITFSCQFDKNYNLYLLCKEDSPRIVFNYLEQYWEQNMSYKNSQQYPNSAWQSLQNFFYRLGIHPLAALIGIILLFIFPRIVITVIIIYVVFRLYRYWSPGNTKHSSIQSFRGKRGGKGKGRR